MKKVKIGDFLHRIKETVNIQDIEEYKRVTIRSKNKGIFLRNIALGKDIGTKKQFIISKGQFLLSKIDARFGAFGIVPENLDKAIITGNFWAYEVDKNIIDIELFNIFVSSKNFIEICSKASSGTTHRKYLDEKKFLNFEIDFPPLEEQKVIIKSYRKKNNYNLLLQSEIHTQQTLLKKLRQSILQEAIEGKLTKEWREQNHDVESASILLEKIKQEKEQLLKDKKIKKQKPLLPISEDEIPFDIPDSWKWCRLGEICNYGSSPKIEPKELNEDTWILDLEDIEKESSKLLQKVRADKRKTSSSKSKFYIGNVLYSKLRPYLDKVIVADEDGVCTTEILPLHFYGSINSYYSKYALKRRDFLLYVNNITKGIKMPRLGTKDGQKALYPLPPLQEQKEIVKKIENLFAVCDALEIEIESSKKSSERLMQVVLKEAFEK